MAKAHLSRRAYDQHESIRLHVLFAGWTPRDPRRCRTPPAHFGLPNFTHRLGRLSPQRAIWRGGDVLAFRRCGLDRCFLSGVSNRTVNRDDLSERIAKPKGADRDAGEHGLADHPCLWDYSLLCEPSHEFWSWPRGPSSCVLRSRRM